MIQLPKMCMFVEILYTVNSIQSDSRILVQMLIISFLVVIFVVCVFVKIMLRQKWVNHISMLVITPLEFCFPFEFFFNLSVLF